MKKMKKLLTGILTMAMVMAILTLPVFAEDAVFDTSKDGSATLTIHKYEYNGDEGSTGTGSSDDTVPTDANPLAGAGFTIYRVVDSDGLSAYYGADPTALPNVSTYVTDGKIKAEYEGTQVGEELTTGTEGTVTFKNLSFGLYVVIETTKPAAVTSAVEPFLVSIPMTSADGSGWLYDVHVYPKNGTKYGEIKLKKTSEDNVALEGVTFVLQKLDTEDSDEDGSTEDWITITKQSGAAGDNTGDELTLVTNVSGLISVSGLSQGTYRFIETSRGDNGDGYIMDGGTAYEFTVNEDGTVTYGENEDASVTITVANEKPDLTKQVKDRETEEWQQDSDYSVGDTIAYKITVDVPECITKLTVFTVTDTPTNLKDDVNSVKLTYTNDDEEEEEDVAKAAYSVAADGVYGFKVTFVPTAMEAYAGKQIIITYNAELLDTAVVTTAGNPNTAALTYSNSIMPTDDSDNPNNGEEPGTDKIEDTAIVYTFQLKIIKTAESKTGTALSGVTFDLYKEDESGTITGDAATALGLDSTKKWTKINEDSLTTGTDGTVSQSGLSNGTYYLVETKTNEGYNLLSEPVEVTLAIEYVTTTKTEYYITEEGEATLVKHEVETTTFSDGESTITTGVVTQNVINKKGFTLPTTGGMGTFAFTIIGIALMAAAVILFLTSRKKKEN